MDRHRTPVHGNYHGYYTKRLPSSSDPRLAVLPPGFLRDKRVLDVGCNEGFVTCEIAQEWAARDVLGVDIDADLVGLAMQRRRQLWSLAEPALHGASGPAVQNLDVYASRSGGRKAPTSTNGHSTEGKGGRTDYFPQSMSYMFGMLPLPNSPPDAPHAPRTFPYNVSFKHADWVNDVMEEDEQGWDVIMGFSITKWIHVNGGDAGLRRFFRKAYNCLRPGGALVLEVQDWDGYRKASRMDSRLRENYRALLLRPDGFSQVLLDEIGFARREPLGVVGEGGFRRPIDLYYK